MNELNSDEKQELDQVRFAGFEPDQLKLTILYHLTARWFRVILKGPGAYMEDEHQYSPDQVSRYVMRALRIGYRVTITTLP